MEIRYDSSKEAPPTVTNTYVPPVVTPPTWPRKAPTLLDIDFKDLDPVNTGVYPLTGKHGLYGASPNPVMGAKFLDSSPGHDGQGGAVHYGQISGAVLWQYNPDGTPNHDWTGKFSNPTVPPVWGVDAAHGLNYLRSATAGCAKEPQPQIGCATCRLFLFNVVNFTPRKKLYLRWANRFAKKTWDGQTDLGIKLSGIVGEELELGQKVAGGWPPQWYRYDAEGVQTVTPIPGPLITWDQWYIFEVGVEANTMTNGVHNADGVIECKIDGVLRYSRRNVKIGLTDLTAAMSQLYHGGQKCPGPLEIDTAAFALSDDWIGPPVGYVP
jgi:hypothetical protein